MRSTTDMWGATLIRALLKVTTEPQQAESRDPEGQQATLLLCKLHCALFLVTVYAKVCVPPKLHEALK